MARVQSHRTSLILDDEDAEDRKILDRQRKAAREAGRTGRDRAGSTSGRVDLESAFDEGAREPAPSAGGKPGRKGGAPTSAPSPGSRGRKGGKGAGIGSIPTPTLKPPKSVTSKDMGGFALGLVLQALVVSYIRYGKAGPKSWLSAKFLNKPIQGDDLEKQNRKDSNNGVDPAPSGRGPNGEVPAEGHMDDNTEIM
ncbi:hypothetical protein ABZ341_41715 [Streptomyces sp. NPDC006173]|uniref:hypothetical protein n=1 Tax=Streptomyces sp. NPDC006173 TaxID=3155349 RepID=UPI0033F72116